MTTRPRERSTWATGIGRTPIQLAALALGIVFLLIAVLGFIPGITTDYGDMKFLGHESDAKLFGLFQVSILHNLVHGLFGVAGVLLARTVSRARWYLVGGGIIYLLLWGYGLLIGHESGANFVPLNTADNWLHFLLGIGMIALGLSLPPRRTT